MKHNEIKILKRETEKEIIKLLNNFQEITSLRINSIDYKIIEHPTLYNTPKYKVVKFNLKIYMNRMEEQSLNFVLFLNMVK